MTEATLSHSPLELPRKYPRSFLFVAAAAWWWLYQLLAPASEALVAVLPVDRTSHLGGALQWEEAAPTLEDVFIHLMGQSRDNALWAA